MAMLIFHTPAQSSNQGADFDVRAILRATSTHRAGMPSKFCRYPRANRASCAASILTRGCVNLQHSLAKSPRYRSRITFRFCTACSASDFFIVSRILSEGSRDLAPSGIA